MGKSVRIEFAEVYFIIQRIAAHMAFIVHLCFNENDFTLYRQTEAQFSASGFYEIHCLSKSFFLFLREFHYLIGRYSLEFVKRLACTSKFPVDVVLGLEVYKTETVEDQKVKTAFLKVGEVKLELLVLFTEVF